MTTNAQHTPGKWMAPRRTSVLGRGIVSTHQGRMICTVAEHDETEANARLIAAAPELLDALDKYADDLCEGWCEKSPDCAHFDDCGGCLARRTAWKATGEPK